MKFAALSLTNAVALAVLGVSASAELIIFVPPYAGVTQVPWCKAPGPAKLPDVLNWYGLICRKLSVVRAYVCTSDNNLATEFQDAWEDFCTGHGGKIYTPTANDLPSSSGGAAKIHW